MLITTRNRGNVKTDYQRNSPAAIVKIETNGLIAEALLVVTDDGVKRILRHGNTLATTKD